MNYLLLRYVRKYEGRMADTQQEAMVDISDLWVANLPFFTLYLSVCSSMIMSVVPVRTELLGRKLSHAVQNVIF
jgi:hypothetical protein